MANKSAKPSGLKLTRDGNKFTATWKRGSSNYTSQTFKWRIKVGKTAAKAKWSAWNNVSVTASTTSKKFTVKASKYNPEKSSKILNAVEFKVCGTEKNKTASDYVDKSYDVKTVKAPTVSAEVSSDYTDVCKFSWSTSDSESTSKYWFVRTERRTARTKNGESPSKWGSITNDKASGSQSIDESSSGLPSDWLKSNVSYTRWFSVRARGPQGNSAWVTKSHVYAVPKVATITSKSASQNAAATRTNISVNWNSNSSGNFPVDSTTVQYLIATPEAGLKAPTSGWTDAEGGKYKGGGSAKHSFSIDGAVRTDQVLWLRVNTKHDQITTEGNPAATKYGRLAEPSEPSIDSVDPNTHAVSLSAKNNSAVPGSYLVVKYYASKTCIKGRDVAIIPAGQESISGVRCPAWNNTEQISFGIRAVVSTKSPTITTNKTTHINTISVSATMSSPEVKTGYVPLPPSDVSIAQTATEGTARISWTWNWSDATGCEISWADHEDAWESTDEPSTYVVTNTHASAWNVSGLSIGITWYFRLRFVRTADETTSYGLYTGIFEHDLTSAPAIPALTLSSNVVTMDGTVTLAWGYISTDGTLQSAAEIAEVITNGNNTQYRQIATTDTAQHIMISPADIDGWNVGDTHTIAMRVKSASGQYSEWSGIQNLTVAEPLVAEIANHPFVSVTIPIGDEGDEERGIIEDEEEGMGEETYPFTLIAMPLRITITGAGENGTTSVAITRSGSYYMDRPDESNFDGNDGETIFSWSQSGEDEITIENEDLIGRLDDSAKYLLTAIVSDEIGQTSSTSMEFTVKWEHQPVIPDAEVVIDDEEKIAILTPVCPEGVELEEGDVCDIYRLSVDKPELVYENAAFGQTYVDPYPTIGEHGGYRFVFKTANNDYITAEDDKAWYDVESPLKCIYNLIDFGTDRAELLYNIDLSSAWKKDFKETQYLGGSVQGDWNPAVSRTGSVNGVVITAQDQDTIKALRRLAVYSGACHVRTKDGSSYTADVQVSETRGHTDTDLTTSFSLSVTRVDPEEYDGVPYNEWIENE